MRTLNTLKRKNGCLVDSITWTEESDQQNNTKYRKLNTSLDCLMLKALSFTS